jgi:hypothetical protein
MAGNKKFGLVAEIKFSPATGITGEQSRRQVGLLISEDLAATKSPTPLWAEDQKSFVSD